MKLKKKKKTYILTGRERKVGSRNKKQPPAINRWTTIDMLQAGRKIM
jgi:hypothetical protein